VGIYVDLNGSRDLVPQPQDLRVLIDEHGNGLIEHGDGAGGWVDGPPFPIDVTWRRTGLEFDWGVDLYIRRSDAFVRNDVVFGLQAMQHGVGAAGYDVGWPVGASPDDPSRWERARIDDLAAGAADSSNPVIPWPTLPPISPAPASRSRSSRR
jgi:hypothetical protein